jgi:hypothetical protein
MDKQQSTILIIGLLIVILATIFSNSRINNLHAWANEYENCVDKNYHTNPIDYYNDHGEYPECVTK